MGAEAGAAAGAGSAAGAPAAGGPRFGHRPRSGGAPQGVPPSRLATLGVVISPVFRPGMLGKPGGKVASGSAAAESSALGRKDSGRVPGSETSGAVAQLGAASSP